MANRRNGQRPIIIVRREEAAEAEAHGGAWKVAYADFVTAMMAFFLLMWLINATTDAQRRGLADYFSPTNRLAQASSGVGKPFGGSTPYDRGALLSDRGALQAINGTKPPQAPRQQTARARIDSGADASEGMDAASGPPLPVRVIWPKSGISASAKGASQPSAPEHAARDGGASHLAPAPAPAVGTGDTPSAAPHGGTGAQPGADPAAAGVERAALRSAAASIRQAIAAEPSLRSVSRQIAVDVTAEGLRIQIMDRDGAPMFAPGSAALAPVAQALLQRLAPILAKLSEPISISGYTDAAPFPDHTRSNWELSAERANAARRLLRQGGVEDARIEQVTGYASRDLLLPAQPMAAANRRVVIVVHRQTP